MNHNNHHYLANAIVPQATSAFSIPIKICDGLFMADHYIAQDSQFFQTNLITHVINCAGQQVQNNKKVCNVAFLTFDWSQNSIQSITEQKVVSVTVNFIEQCRKQAGCLLIHYSNSQSRPFCLLACYFMVKFKWSLFKTLQFLNSRKQDVELQPAFFQQLTSFAQKLQDKGLIRSKNWMITQGMSDQQIIITNTYLNSKNKFAALSSNHMIANKNKKSISVTWKKDILIQHAYCPNSIIQDKPDNKQKEKQKQRQKANDKIEKVMQRKSLGESTRNDRNQVNNSKQKRDDSLRRLQKQNTNPSRNSIIQQKPGVSTSMTQMSVTKKWAQLRQMWLRQKQNHNGNINANTSKGKQYNYNESIIQKQQNSVLNKDNQRINDKLQQKLSLLKKHEQKLQLQNKEPKGSKKQQSHSYNETNTNTERIQAKLNEQMYHNNQQNNSRILHNNWIIDNHQIGQNSGQRSIKNKLNTSGNGGNKSVIIVKPNHGSSSLENKIERQKDREREVKIDKIKEAAMFNSNNVSRQNHRERDNNNASRSSLRKTVGSERKQNSSSLNKDNKENSGAGTKFFRNEAADIISTKGRCSSAKPQRRQNINNVPLGLGLSKNSSLKSKGKWKF